MAHKKDRIKKEEVPMKNVYGTNTHKSYAHAPNVANMEASYQHNVTVQRDVPSQPPPRDYLIMSILVTMFCCLPCGVVGLVKSSMVKTLYQTGHYEEAKRTSESALNWSRTSLIIGLVVLITNIIFVVEGSKWLQHQDRASEETFP